MMERTFAAIFAELDRVTTRVPSTPVIPPRSWFPGLTHPCPTVRNDAAQDAAKVMCAIADFEVK